MGRLPLEVLKRKSPEEEWLLGKLQMLRTSDVLLAS